MLADQPGLLTGKMLLTLVLDPLRGTVIATSFDLPSARSRNDKGILMLSTSAVS